MKAFILAAGRGERMRPYTDELPKPLLEAGGKSLIEHRLLALKAAGITDCIVNLAYRGEQIRQALGNGSRIGLNIEYSDEGPDALESAGGIIHALPLLGDGPFIVVNADIWTDFNFCELLQQPKSSLAHLVLVDNPPHHPQGDFALNHNTVFADGDSRLTYSGIAVFQPALFAAYPAGKRPLKPVLVSAMSHGRVSGQHYRGIWQDIGTPARLQELQTRLKPK